MSSQQFHDLAGVTGFGLFAALVFAAPLLRARVREIRAAREQDHR